MSRFLIGASDGTLTLLKLAGDELSVISSNELNALGPMALHPSGVVLFAQGDPFRVSALRVADDDQIEAIGGVEVAGKSAHLSISPDGNWALSASYHSHHAQLIRLVAGIPAEVTARVEGQNLHSSILTADGCAHIVGLRDDVILSYRIVDGALEPLSSNLQLPAGCGPRHIIAGQDSDLLVNTEFTGEVFRLGRRDDGTLEVLSSTKILDETDLAVSRFGAKPRAEHLIWGSDLRMSKDGNRLFCAERTNGTISTLRLEDGSPTTLEAVSFVVAQPRGFGIASDSSLLVPSETDGQLRRYLVATDGSLTIGGVAPVGTGAQWVTELPN